MTKVWIQNQPRIDGISSQNYYNTQKKLNLTIPKKVSFEGEMVKPNEWLDNFSCFEKEMKRGFFPTFYSTTFFQAEFKTELNLSILWLLAFFWLQTQGLYFSKNQEVKKETVIWNQTSFSRPNFSLTFQIFLSTSLL